MGASRFTRDEESLLFLSERQSTLFGKNFTVVGLSQGKYNIAVDPITQEKEVYREQISLPLELETDGVELPLTSERAMNLSNFIMHITRFVK